MGTRPRLGQVLGHAMVGSMRWQCRDDTGLPRTWLVKAWRRCGKGDTRDIGLVGDVSLKTHGAGSKDPVGQVPGVLGEGRTPCVVKVHKLCRVKNYSNSRVLGHGTHIVLGHTRSTRNC